MFPMDKARVCSELSAVSEASILKEALLLTGQDKVSGARNLHVEKAACSESPTRLVVIPSDKHAQIFAGINL
jgi:hypothetical protein